MKQLKLLTFLIFFLLIFSPLFVNAQNLQNAFGGNTSDSGPIPPSAFDQVVTEAGYSAGTTFDSIVGQVILTALSFLGIIFLILLIYAGFLWMTASGNDQQVSKAKSIITTAIIGLIIVLSAYSISYFVLSSLQEGTLNESAG